MIFARNTIPKIEKWIVDHDVYCLSSSLASTHRTLMERQPGCKRRIGDKIGVGNRIDGGGGQLSLPGLKEHGIAHRATLLSKS
jgi:hypothetical protein